MKEKIPTPTACRRACRRSTGLPRHGRLSRQPKYIAIIYEAFNLWRQVFMDGREMEPDANPTWMGYSTGKWEGDTLVVDSRGFNGKAWLDQLGKPSTDALHVIERFHRQDFGHMNLQITIDDPESIHEAVDCQRGGASAAGYGVAGVHLQ